MVDPAGYATLQIGGDGNFTKNGIAGGINIGALLTTNNQMNPLKWSVGGYVSLRGGTGVGVGEGFNITITGSENNSVDAIRGAAISSGYSLGILKLGIGQEWHRPMDKGLHSFHELGVEPRRMFDSAEALKKPVELSMHAANVSYTFASGRTIEHRLAGIMDMLDQIPGKVSDTVSSSYYSWRRSPSHKKMINNLIDQYREPDSPSRKAKTPARHGSNFSMWFESICE